MAEETPPLPSTAPKPFVFVLMPFEEQFDDIYNPVSTPAMTSDCVG